jgi:excisionase family DNA binding protein
MPSTTRGAVIDIDKLPYFLDIEEAAALIGIGKSTAYDAARRGDIPTVRFGRRLRVPRAALLELGHRPATAPFEPGDAA